jgi:YD repeat-containing protein
MVRILMVVGLLCGLLRPAAAAEVTVRYFRNFTGHDLPIKLREEISEAEAKTYVKALLVARYDGRGRLIEVTKLIKAKEMFVHHYEYDASGRLKMATVRNADGDVSVVEFDEKGKGGRTKK